MWQNFPHMNPGTKVFAFNLHLRGFVGKTNTALISMNQPLNPYIMHSPHFELPPKPITQSEDYPYFNFSRKHLQTGGATYLINVCNASLCQGAGDKNDPCRCISACNREFGLTKDLFCPEFELELFNVPIVKYGSVPLGTTGMGWPKSLTSFP